MLPNLLHSYESTKISKKMKILPKISARTSQFHFVIISPTMFLGNATEMTQYIYDRLSYLMIPISMQSCILHHVYSLRKSKIGGMGPRVGLGITYNGAIRGTQV